MSKGIIQHILTVLCLVAALANSLSAKSCPPKAKSGCGTGSKPIAFSELPLVKQRAIEERVAPPPVAQRDAPYSTPMYYLFSKGYQDGVGAAVGKGNLVLDRNRPDWQEDLLKNWVELGLTSTHFLTYPSQWEDPYAVQAIEDYFALSKKQGLRIGLRLGGDQSFGGLEGSGWDLHPNNPENRIDEYIAWAKKVAAMGKGRVDYYVLGDELNLGRWEAPTGQAGKTRGYKAEEGKKWTPDVYMKVFAKLSQAIKSVDPQAKVSMFGMGGLDWDYVDGLFKAGYARYADGVAANIGNQPYEKIQNFVKNVMAVAPHFKFYSNGVGYVGVKDTNFYPTNSKGKYTELEHGILVGKIMFRCFDAGWDSTPYYIVVRQWQLADGSYAPHWYGFFGFLEPVLDKYDNMTFKKYPGWYSFQTISHIFYSKSNTKLAPYKMKLSKDVDFSRVYLRNNYECLLVLWNNKAGKKTTTSITLPNQKYKYPVHINLCNYRQYNDLPYQLNTDGSLVIPDVKVTDRPVIIRLIAE